MRRKVTQRLWCRHSQGDADALVLPLLHDIKQEALNLWQPRQLAGGARLRRKRAAV